MVFEIVVPELGESIVEATVARWLKNEGDSVKAGEAVVVLETEKVDLEVGAEKDGVLSKITRQAGEDVKIGEVLGVIVEGASHPEAAGAKEETPSAKSASTAETSASAPKESKIASQSGATPVARRVAEDAQVNIHEVPAEGTRVKKQDVQRFIQSRNEPAPRPPAASVEASAPYPVTGGDQSRREERIKMSRRRRTIAVRLVEAQQTAAMLTTFNEIDMSAVMAIREKRKESFRDKYGVGLGYSSFFVKATIGALKANPRLNAEIQGDDMVLKHYYDIGVAIGAEEGLVVPVLRDADRLSFAQIETAIKRFAQDAQKGTLSLEALRGGTFTITNGGVFGSLMSTPILNPPQVAILGLHKIQQRPVAVDGQVIIRPMMYVALSYDHRIVDGREAVTFLVRVKELIEDPETLLVEG